MNDLLDYKQLFETVPGLYLILSPDLTIIAVNDAYNKATMTKRETIVGHDLFEIFPDNPDDLTADGVSNLRKSLDYVIKYKKKHSMAVQKYDIRRPDGTFEERYWSPINSPLLNSSNELTAIIHKVEDVTELVRIQQAFNKNKKLAKGLQIKLLEMESEVISRSKEIQKMNEQLEDNIRQLRESENKFQTAFHASAAAMTIIRLSDSTYLDVNDTFVKMTGCSREEIIGKTSAELGLVLDMEKREQILKELKKTGSVKNFEMSIQNKSGITTDILSSIEIVILNGEKHAINIIYDITNRKKSEEQLALVNQELESFSYSVSHDLRAPLRAINGYAEMLTEDYHAIIDDEGKRLLGNIKHYAEKMGTLIDDLLNFSRLGRKEIQKREIDMNDLMEGVIIDMEKSRTFHAEITIGKLHPIHADYGLIHQVMFNLLSNALKYSSKKEKPIVEISSQEKNKEIIFTVKDNGAGFNMQFANKLFGVFQRLHSQEEFHGTGVGLAIVQRIISKHEGKVWAEGKVDEGASFYFSLKK